MKPRRRVRLIEQWRRDPSGGRWLDTIDQRHRRLRAAGWVLCFFALVAAWCGVWLITG